MAKISDEDLEIKAEVIPQSMLIEYLRLRNRVEFLEQSIRRSLQLGAVAEKGDVTAELRDYQQTRISWKEIAEEHLSRDVIKKIVADAKPMTVTKMEVKVKPGAMFKEELA